MPGQQNTILFDLNGAAAGALGSPSPAGVVEAGTNKEQQTFYKKMKNVPKQITAFSKSSLGIQFSLAAMLRQSQIATGFLGALFQVLGAIADSFLVAFAPDLFAGIAAVAKLIPVAKQLGENIAENLEGVKNGIIDAVRFLLPIFKGIWTGVSWVAKMVGSLPDMVKTLGLIALFGMRLFNLFQVKHYVLMHNVTFRAVLKALTIHSAKSGGGGGGGGGLMSGKGIMRMVGKANLYLMIAMAVVAIGTTIFTMFKNRGKGSDSGSGVDVSGQLGRSYRPPSGMQLGGGDPNAVLTGGDPNAVLTTTFEAIAAEMPAHVDGILAMYTGVGDKASEAMITHMAMLDPAARSIEQFIGALNGIYTVEKAAEQTRTLSGPTGHGGVLSTYDEGPHIKEMEKAAKEYTQARSKMTKMQIEHERQMNAIKVREAEELRAAQLAIWDRTIDEGY